MTILVCSQFSRAVKTLPENPQPAVGFICCLWRAGLAWFILSSRLKPAQQCPELPSRGGGCGALEAAVCWPGSPWARTGPVGAMAQQFSSPLAPWCLWEAVHNPGCFVPTATFSEGRVIPADVTPKQLPVPSVMLGTRVWDEGLGPGLVCLCFPSPYSFLGREERAERYRGSC